MIHVPKRVIAVSWKPGKGCKGETCTHPSNGCRRLTCSCGNLLEWPSASTAECSIMECPGCGAHHHRAPRSWIQTRSY